MAKNIISLKLNSRDDITQEGSAVTIIANTMTTADITANTIILDEADVANNSYI